MGNEIVERTKARRFASPDVFIKSRLVPEELGTFTSEVNFGGTCLGLWGGDAGYPSLMLLSCPEQAFTGIESLKLGHLQQKHI